MRHKPTRAQRICRPAPIVHAPKPADVGLRPHVNDEGPTGANGQAPREQSKAERPKSTQPKSVPQGPIRIPRHCIGCGVPAVPWAVVAGIQHPLTGEIAWACDACAQRASDSDLFYQQLLTCIGSGVTLPEMRDAFARYGFDLPTTDAERARVMARVFGDPVA